MDSVMASKNATKRSIWDNMDRLKKYLFSQPAFQAIIK